MRVPIRRQPGTNVTPITEGFQRAQAGPDFSPFTNVIRGFAKELEDGQKGMEEFDLQKRLMQETNELQADFAKRQEEAPLGASGFTDTVLSDYEARHTAILDEYHSQGYNTELLQGAAVRLGSLRQQFGERALVFQHDSTRSLATKNLEEFKVGVSQYVTNNPIDGWESGVEELRSAVERLPGLNAQEREGYFAKSVDELRAAAGKGAALANPQLVIEKLDPKGLTAPQVAPGTNGGAYGILSGWQAVPTTIAAKYGLDAVEVAALMSFESGGTFDPKKRGGDGGRYEGLIQAGPSERAEFGIDPNLPPEQYAQALIRFFDKRGFKPGMGIEDMYSTILTGGPGNYDRQDSNGTSVRKVIHDITTGEHRTNAENWLRAAAPVQDANALGAEPASLNPFDPGASQVPAAPALASLTPEQAAQEDPRTTKTGVALFDAMNGAERLQVLGWAREKTNQQTAQVKGAMDVAVSNKIEANLRGDGDATPTLTREQVIAGLGPLEGEQKWAAVEASQNANAAMQKMKTLSPGQIDTEIARLEPDASKATYLTDAKFYDAAIAAKKAIIEQRDADPAKYVLTNFPNIGEMEGPEKYAAMERALTSIGIERDVYLTKEQQRKLGQEYTTIAGGRKRAFLEGLVAEMGSSTAGAQLSRAVYSFDPEAAPEVARDFALYALTKNNPNVFDDVQKGLELIKEDRARKLSPGAIDSAYLVGVGSAIRGLSGKMSALVNTATEALYVQKGGQLDANGDVDTLLYKSALREALGGKGGDPDTGIVSISGNPKVADATILPPGTNKQAFQSFIDRVNNSDFAQLGNGQPRDSTGGVIPLYQIQSLGVFVMQAPGIYAIKFAPNKYALNKNGGRFTMRISAAEVLGK